MRAPAKTFEDLIVWQKAHQLVLAVAACRGRFLGRKPPVCHLNFAAHLHDLILVQDHEYGDVSGLRSLLEEVSKLLEVYSQAILNSGS